MTLDLPNPCKRPCTVTQTCVCAKRLRTQTGCNAVKHWFTAEEWWLCLQGLLPLELADLVIHFIQLKETADNCGWPCFLKFKALDDWVATCSAQAFFESMNSIKKLGQVSGGKPLFEVLRTKYYAQSEQFSIACGLIFCTHTVGGACSWLYFAAKYCRFCERLFAWSYCDRVDS